MTITNGQGSLRRSILFSAIEQAAAPTVELDELAPKIDEADWMAIGDDRKDSISGGQQPSSGGSAAATVGN